MAETADFWDRVADRYAAKPVKDAASYEATLERTRAHLSGRNEVLEVGCGTGTTALRLAASVERITATDVSARMIAIAREKARAQAVENVRLEQATLFDPGLAPGSFDAVLAFNLLHLLPDLPGALRRIHALLVPGGVFVSKTICLGDRARLWRPVLAVMRALGLAPEVTFLRSAELEDEVEISGFAIVESEFLPASSASRFVVARKA